MVVPWGSDSFPVTPNTAHSATVTIREILKVGYKAELDLDRHESKTKQTKFFADFHMLPELTLVFRTTSIMQGIKGKFFLRLNE